jgi:hypothetical protein
MGRIFQTIRPEIWSKFVATRFEKLLALLAVIGAAIVAVVLSKLGGDLVGNPSATLCCQCW